MTAILFSMIVATSAHVDLPVAAGLDGKIAETETELSRYRSEVMPQRPRSFRGVLVAQF